MSIEQEIRAKLAELGDTPRAIADKLQELGITGTNVGGCCPLYYYLASSFPSVGWVTAKQVKTAATNEMGKVLADLPEACQNFVFSFDAGLYPALWRRSA